MIVAGMEKLHAQDAGNPLGIQSKRKPQRIDLLLADQKNREPVMLPADLLLKSIQKSRAEMRAVGHALRQQGKLPDLRRPGKTLGLRLKVNKLFVRISAALARILWRVSSASTPVLFKALETVLRDRSKASAMSCIVTPFSHDHPHFQKYCYI